MRARFTAQIELLLDLLAMVEWIERWTDRHPRLRRLKASALCQRDTPVTSVWGTIGWWEARRVPYNLVVGAAGILSCVVVLIFGLAGYFFFHAEFPAPAGLTVIAVIVYGMIANAFYTGGWVVELVVRKAWPAEADRFATLSFTLGLAFSFVLTLVPAAIVTIAGVFGLLAHAVGLAK